jgi:phosphoribosylamine--glycine ligase
MVVTGTGASVAAAKAQAYARAGRISIPNVRYRLDIGDRLIAGEFETVERLGLLGES